MLRDGKQTKMMHFHSRQQVRVFKLGNETFLQFIILIDSDEFSSLQIEGLGKISACYKLILASYRQFLVTK